MSSEFIGGGRYQVLRQLGAGQFGSVYLVTEPEGPPENLSCMKRLFVGMLDENEVCEALGEYELLKNLSHPNIIRYSHGFLEEASGHVCIITEYCEGGDLAQHISNVREKKSAIPKNQIFEWFVQLSLALKHIHDRNILHRDLKTRNVLLRKNVIKLCDFGIARVLQSVNEKATSFAGTPYYMAPETFQNTGYNSKSDVWSLGCVLHELCCLRHVFEGESLMGLMYKICNSEYPELPKQYGPELQDLARGLLNRDPMKRPTVDTILHMPLIQEHTERFASRLGDMIQPIPLQKSLDKIKKAGQKQTVSSTGIDRFDSRTSSEGSRASTDSADLNLTPRQRMLKRREERAALERDRLNTLAKETREKNKSRFQQSKELIHSPSHKRLQQEGAHSTHSVEPQAAPLRQVSDQNPEDGTDDTASSSPEPVYPWIASHPDIFTTGRPPSSISISRSDRGGREPRTGGASNRTEIPSPTWGSTSVFNSGGLPPCVLTEGAAGLSDGDGYDYESDFEPLSSEDELVSPEDEILIERLRFECQNAATPLPQDSMQESEKDLQDLPIPQLREKKLEILRRDCTNVLGEDAFKTVFDVIMDARKSGTTDDEMLQKLRSKSKRTSGEMAGWALVDQLVCAELLWRPS